MFLLRSGLLVAAQPGVADFGVEEVIFEQRTGTASWEIAPCAGAATASSGVGGDCGKRVVGPGAS